MRPVTILSLVAQLGPKRIAELTTGDVMNVAGLLGAKLDPSTASALVKVLATDDGNTVADYLAEPERLKGLLGGLLAHPQREPRLIRCPHCFEFFNDD